MKKPCHVLVLAISLLAGQGSAADAQQWRFSLSPYLLFPNMNGQSGVGDHLVEVDANPADIFDKLKFGAMLVAEANNGTWGVAIDAIYMKLEQEGSRGPFAGRIEGTQGALELAGFRRITAWLELLAGVRGNRLSATLESDEPVARSTEQEDTWWDPIFGARIRTGGTGKWLLEFRADYGGFDIGSEAAWQVHPRVGYRISQGVELGLGYRVISINYSTATSSFSPFVYDMLTFGPEIGLVFHF